ncbi:phosphoribosylglycinamide formyltransferase [Thermoclostridium caenicola]|uniref:Phosphoribosylglycinamide formyltransferase n=1 Tax=Thermoclostridium caenicola TaxID=659425 RepID=A0A1M6BAN6_9FIRM|nr:phosphoribosylglycinamide formyltransferase [Thermoclostridium caenicola]SHI45772.1 formyltetrahydrofolate-dependent phosphoribosylglycinamide formyltransferase [Thermoclostridium caenicola]
MLNIGVMVSGGGTNLQAILDQIESGKLPGCRVVTVISSRPGVYALERAKKHHIPCCVISRKDFETQEAYDEAVLNHLKHHDVQLVVLAGFLSLLGERVITAYRNAVINVHPSLIPAFCGKGFYGLIPHKKALEYGVRVTGATVHFVDCEYDSGPIILQKAVEVMADDTPESLQRRVMEQAEWILLPEAIRLFAQGRLKVEGRRVTILNETPERKEVNG